MRGSSIDKRNEHEMALENEPTHFLKAQAMIQKFFSGEELFRSTSPDEAVAISAAVQADALAGEDSSHVEVLSTVRGWWCAHP